MLLDIIIYILELLAILQYRQLIHYPLSVPLM